MPLAVTAGMLSNSSAAYALASHLGSFEAEFSSGALGVEQFQSRASSLRRELTEFLAGVAQGEETRELLRTATRSVEGLSRPGSRAVHTELSQQQRAALRMLLGDIPELLGLIQSISERVEELGRVAASLDRIRAALDSGGTVRAARIVALVADDVVGCGLQRVRRIRPSRSAQSASRYVLRVVRQHSACNAALARIVAKLERQIASSLERPASCDTQSRNPCIVPVDWPRAT